MTRFSTIAALFAALVVLSSCGSDSSVTSAADSTSETTSSTVLDDATTEDSVDGNDATDDEMSDDSTSDDSSEGDDSSDDGASAAVSLDDLPSECRDALADFLRAIEPTVSEIDWETATLADMETMGTDIEAPGTELDTKLAEANCPDFEPDADDGSIAMMIEFAEDEAPGTVGWLTFISTLASSVDENGISEGSADLPTDCDGAIAYVEAATTQADSMMDLPLTEFTNLGAVMQTIQSECPVEQTAAFFEANADFFSGQ